MWLCECDCENHTRAIVKGSSLRRGHSKSCGCLKKEAAREVGHNNALSLEGRTFGKLKVLEKGYSKNYKIFWKCECSCANHTIVYVSSDKLVNKHTQSCGCLASEDLSGLIFGNLQMIKLSTKPGHPKEGKYWECKCLCNNEEVITKTTSQLKSMYNLSCGCLNHRSLGESVISQMLRINNIYFETEKTFDNCRFEDSKKLAKFDFWVENKYIIEFDGEQHFNYRNNGWNTLEHYQRTQIRDNYKNEWCKINNIPLIRIPYTHLDNLTLNDLKLETSQFIM